MEKVGLMLLLLEDRTGCHRESGLGDAAAGGAGRVSRRKWAWLCCHWRSGQGATDDVGLVMLPPEEWVGCHGCMAEVAGASKVDCQVCWV